MQKDNYRKMSEPLNGKKVFTLDEAAAYTGYSVNYIYKLVYERKIKFYKPLHGRKLFFTPEDLRAYITAFTGKTIDEIRKS